MTAPIDSPDETLEAIGEDECLYVERDEPDDAYIWADPEPDEEGYALLERTSRGTWIMPHPISEDGAIAYLERLPDDVGVEVNPQTNIPDGKNPIDRL